MESLDEFEVVEEVVDKQAVKEEAWYAQRSGKLTCSNFGKLIGVGQNREQFTKTGYDYLRLVIAERLGSWHDFSSASVRYGQEHEAQVIAEYSEVTGSVCDAEPYRFVEFDNNIGGTPDGLVGHVGCLEIKCPWNPAVHINTLLSEQIPKEYIWQVVGHCLVTKRKWCDFVSCDPRISGPGRMAVIRWERDEKAIQFLQSRLTAAVEWIEEQMKVLES